MPAPGARLMRGFRKHDPHQGPLATLPKTLLAAVCLQRNLRDRRLPPPALPCLRSTGGPESCRRNSRSGEEACAAIGEPSGSWRNSPSWAFAHSSTPTGPPASPTRLQSGATSPGCARRLTVSPSSTPHSTLIRVLSQSQSVVHPKKKTVAPGPAGPRPFLVAEGWASEKALAPTVGAMRTPFAAARALVPRRSVGSLGSSANVGVISVTSDAIAIETASGARLRFHRRAYRDTRALHI